MPEAQGAAPTTPDPAVAAAAAAAEAQKPDAAAPAATETPAGNEDAFAAAFAEIAAAEAADPKGKDRNEPSDGANKAAAAATAKTDEKPAAAAEGEAAGGAPVKDPTAEGAPAADPAKPKEEAKPAAKADEKPKEEAKPKSELAELAELLKAQKDAPKEEPKPAPRQDEGPQYTADEVAFLNEYEKDWPDVSRAEALKRRGEYERILGFMMEQLKAHVQPLAQTVEALSDVTSLGILEKRVDNYAEVRDKMVEWVKEQPKYLQDAMNRVIEHGTVDEVVDLIQRYQKDTGTVISKAAPAAEAKPAPAQTVKKDSELPPAAKKAAAALAPVQSKRSAIVAQNDPDDFDSSFAHYAEKGV